MSVSSVSSTSTTTSSTSSSAMSTLTESTDAFLQLLITQLQVQDPTDPVDTTTFVSQLVDLANLEQAITNGETLETISSTSTTIAMGTSGLSYLGEEITADGDTTAIQDGKATWEYDLGEDASSVTLSVTDEDGTVVYSSSLDDTDSGTHTLTWDGEGTNGKTYSDGAYTLAVTATNASGSSIDADIRVKGTVTSVDNSDGTISLGIGDASVAASDVVSLSS